MTQRRDNLIDGLWVAGEKCTLSINPSNLSDLIGESTLASNAQYTLA